MKNNVGKGALVLVVAGLICKFFGGLFRLPLTNIVGLEGIALYQMVITIYSFSLVFVSGGVTTSLSKLVSSARAKERTEKIGAYLRIALMFSLGLSFLFGILFLLLANPISQMQGSLNGAGCYRLIALLLPLGAFVGVARGMLQGYGNMTPTAISQIIEQVLKFAFGLVFAYFFKTDSDECGVLGALWGIIIGEFFACFYLANKLFSFKKLSFKQNVRKEFFSASLPLTFGGIVLPLTHTVEAIFAVRLISFSGLSIEMAKNVFGIQTGVVGAILNFPLIISLALSAALLPNLSYMAERGEDDEQKRLIELSISQMWFFLVPIVVGLVSVSSQLYSVLYPSLIEGYLPLAYQLTILGGISTIITALMQQLVVVLQANGWFGKVFLFYVIGGIVKVSLLVAISFIPEASVYSIAISNIALASCVCLCALLQIKRLVVVNWFSIVLPLLAAMVMFLVVKILLSFIGGLAGLALAVVVGGGVYLVLCFPLVGKYFNLIFARVKKRRE